jgi:SAM-dependent MidA family methyltransferase
MPSPLLSLILGRIRDNGPVTVREFVEQALYHDQFGYYASAQQRSGREGDFFTSVDLGPLFGELLATQFVEMWERLGRCDPFDLVEAAAGNGRLARDVLDCAAARHADFYRVVRLHLAERSPRARERQRDVLGEHLVKLSGSHAGVSDRVTGVVYANELLDALPPHLVVMREDGLREIYVDEGRGGLPRETPGRLRTVEGHLSTPRIAEYLDRVGARLGPGWFAEVNLAAADWVQDVAQRLERGFLVLVDYGHEAATLYSASHAAGTLTTFRRHASEGREAGPGWLMEPGERDITSHVDLTGVRLAGLDAGLECLGTVDQTYFLLGLGLAARLLEDGAADAVAIKRRLALKTLLLPGGMGSTHKVLIFGKRVDAGALRGLSGGRLT